MQEADDADRLTGGTTALLAWLSWVLASAAAGAIGGTVIDAVGLPGVVAFGAVGGTAQ